MTTLEGRSKRRTHEHSSLLPDSDAGPIQRSSASVVVAPWTGNRRLDRPQRNAGPASQVPRLCRGVRGACNRSWHLHVSRCASADAAAALMHGVVGVRCDKALAALHSAHATPPQLVLTSPELVTGGERALGHDIGVLTVVLGGTAEKNLVLICSMCQKGRVKSPAFLFLRGIKALIALTKASSGSGPGPASNPRS